MELGQDQDHIEALHEYELLVLFTEHNFTIYATDSAHNWDERRHFLHRFQQDGKVHVAEATWARHCGDLGVRVYRQLVNITPSTFHWAIGVHNIEVLVLEQV